MLIVITTGHLLISRRILQNTFYHTELSQPRSVVIHLLVSAKKLVLLGELMILMTMIKLIPPDLKLEKLLNVSSKTFIVSWLNMMMLSSIFVLLTQKLKNNSSFKVKNAERGEAESTVILLNIHHHQQFQDIKMLLMVSVHQVTNHQLLLFTTTHLIRQSHHRKSSKPLDWIGPILIQS